LRFAAKHCQREDFHRHVVLVYILHTRAGGLVKKETIRAALVAPHHGQVQQLGDYLMLYLLTKNLNPLVVKDMYTALAPEKYGAKEEEVQALQKNHEQ